MDVKKARCAVSRSQDSEEGRCEKPGEVEFRGALLCMPHAEMLKASEQIEHWEVTFFRMEIWLSTARDMGNADLIRFLEPGREISEIKLNRAQQRLENARHWAKETTDVAFLRLVG